MEIAIAMGVFFVLFTMAYIAMALFLPEWVGITGKKAKEVMKEQQGDPAEVASTEAQALSHDTTKPHQ